jgi:hypothetical protein
LSVTCGWWTGRRDALLGALARELLLWGEDVLDDPGAGEIAALLADIAERAAADRRDPVLGEAARLLDRAARECARADRFLGGFLPQVVRHLRTALDLLRQARQTLTERQVDHGGVPVAH